MLATPAGPEPYCLSVTNVLISRFNDMTAAAILVTPMSYCLDWIYRNAPAFGLNGMIAMAVPQHLCQRMAMVGEQYRFLHSPMTNSRSHKCRLLKYLQALYQWNTYVMCI